MHARLSRGAADNQNHHLLSNLHKSALSYLFIVDWLFLLLYFKSHE